MRRRSSVLGRPSDRSRRRRIFPGVEQVEDRMLLATFRVMNTDDRVLDSNNVPIVPNVTVADSLRDAIERANAQPNTDMTGDGIPDPDVIVFDVSGTINVVGTAPLDPITEPLIIDGSTQSIEVNGRRLETRGADGFVLDAGDSVIRGLRITSFNGSGIEITSANNSVGGLATGTTIVQSALDLPLRIPPTGTGSAGGPTPQNTTTSAINISNTGAISDVNVTLSLVHTFDGDLTITLIAPNGTRIPLSIRNGVGGDNYLNTTFDDEAATPVDSGSPPFNGSFQPESPLSILDGTEARGPWMLEVQDLAPIDTGTLTDFTLTIQTQGSEVRNVLSANSEAGVHITGAGATDNVVLGNLIGTDVTGTVPMSNGFAGVLIDGGASSNTIGGVALGAGNVISGNQGPGVYVLSDPSTDPPGTAPPTGNIILGNFIGTDLFGTIDLGNFSDGVLIENATGSIIGTPVLFSSGTTINQAATDLPQRIPPSDTGGTGVPSQDITRSVITIGATGRITNIDVGLSLTHTFDGDLVITLIAPDGTRVLLSDGNGGGGENYTNTIFDDDALLSIIDADPPFTGSFQPEDSLAVLNGTNPNGDWVLEVDDQLPGDTGELTAFSLMIQTEGIGSSNLISFNGRDGIQIIGDLAEDNVALGNLISNNFRNGVLIQDAFSNTIGGAEAGARNIISANRGNGVAILGDESLDTFAAENVVLGNAIMNNTSNGVLIQDAFSNTIGGTTDGAANVISGNTGSGIAIGGSDATDNVVLGNFIEINGEDGVTIEGVSFNTIGGVEAGAGNVISGNARNGVLIRGLDATDNVVLGNFIGVDFIDVDASDLFPLPNSFDGVLIQDAAGNTIGGAVPGAGNVISGNARNGVQIRGPGATDNVVLGNFIGVDSTGRFVLDEGESTLANAGNGVLIQGAPGNTIGGAEAGARNIISANRGNGVEITGSGATDNVVAGNFIGTDAMGILKQGNSQSGVLIQNASRNTIGGLAPGARNVISDNRNSGIEIFDRFSSLLPGTDRVSNPDLGATRNLVLNNYIGTDFSGSRNLGNFNNGINLLGAHNNTIGGTTPAARNVISANGGSGISIASRVDEDDPQFRTAQSNVIQGNYIGTDPTGQVIIDPGPDVQFRTADDQPLGNFNDGITLSFATRFNTIGGAAASAGLAPGNVISGNQKNGISFLITADSNVVQGNLIGTDALGTSDRGNNLIGIFIQARSNSIGGASDRARNIISGNDLNGVTIAGEDSRNNLVQSNFIGTNANGTEIFGPGRQTIGNSQGGVFINDAPDNTIAGNVISGNLAAGIQIFNVRATGNQVRSNRIGTNADGTIDLGNSSNGVFLNGSSNNTIAGNVISGNDGSGIEILGNVATGNGVVGNLIGTNAAGTAILANSLSGLFINDARGNTIGAANVLNIDGTINALNGNVISGNGVFGIQIVALNAITGMEGGNLVLGNLIGLNATGNARLGNILDGVNINNAPNTTIGGLTPEARNVISGNGEDGLELFGPTTVSTVVVGNYIGTNASGSIAVGNFGDGIRISNAPRNTIGALNDFNPNQTIRFLRGNVLSANAGAGLHLTGGTVMTTVVGNLIGTDAVGGAPLPNEFGVFLEDVVRNTIGGTTPEARNIISSNRSIGIQIFQVRPGEGNAVQGNYIGTDVRGLSALGNGFGNPDPNAGIGVFLNNATNTTIGGTAPGAGNLISGNNAAGITIFGRSFEDAPGNTVVENIIGTSVLRGPLGLPGQNPSAQATPQVVGVAINSSINNRIVSNHLSGNVIGVLIAGDTARRRTQTPPLDEVEANPSNQVLSNTIIANAFGVFINGASENAIGGGTPETRNSILDNASIGVSITGRDASRNIVRDNLINTNRNTGIYIESARSNRFRDNEVQGNGEVGVYLFNGATQNQFRNNRIRGNGLYGVFLFNSAGNALELRNRANRNSIQGGRIASFREFTNNRPLQRIGRQIPGDEITNNRPIQQIGRQTPGDPPPVPQTGRRRPRPATLSQQADRPALPRRPRLGG